MKNLIEYILIHIVDNPEDVKVEVETEGNNSTYSITVHEDDMGRVIGKKGSVIQAIRTIARVRAIKEGERARIIVVDTDAPPMDSQTEMPAAVPEEADVLEAETPTEELVD